MAYAFGRFLTAAKRRKRPQPENRMGPLRPWTSSCLPASRSGRNARGLFHDGEAHASFVPVLLRDRAPGLFGLLAGLERALNLGRALHQLVEVHRTEPTPNPPEISALFHESLLPIQPPEPGFPNRGP